MENNIIIHMKEGYTPRERPIQASGPMLMDILEDQKTQMRFVIEPQPHPSCVKDGAGWHWHGRGQVDEYVWNSSVDALTQSMAAEGSPYGRVGDWLWVQEDAYIAPPNFTGPDRNLCNKVDDQGRPQIVGWVTTMSADAIRCAKDYGVELTNAPLIPRWASQLTLEITDVRIQHLQDISEEDAKAEGIRLTHGGVFVGREGPGNLITPWPTAREAFADIWDDLHGPDAWASNPWVWAMKFKRAQ